MKTRAIHSTLPLALALALAAGSFGSPTGSAQAAAAHAGEPAKPATIRDLLWVWGNPEMAKPGKQTVATFAEASPAQRAQLLGVPNVVLAGNGIPNDDQEADRQTQEVAAHPRLVWEISADGSGDGRPFVYQQRMAQVRRLVDRYPQIEGVLLDDMSTIGIDHGFKPEHIRQIRELLTALDRWVSIGHQPPASRYPRIADGRLVNLETYCRLFPRIPAMHLPTGLYASLRLDFGLRRLGEGIAEIVPSSQATSLNTRMRNSGLRPGRSQLSTLDEPDVRS